MSVPVHCELMEPARARLVAKLEDIRVNAPGFPVIHNADNAPHGDAAAIRGALADQLTKPVRWVASVLALRAHGARALSAPGAGRVVLRTAPDGTGVVAGGPMRAGCELPGVKVVGSKSIGSHNPYNVIRATLDGIKKQASPRCVAQRRGKKVADILGAKPEAAAETPAEAEKRMQVGP